MLSIFTALSVLLVQNNSLNKLTDCPRKHRANCRASLQLLGEVKCRKWLDLLCASLREIERRSQSKNQTRRLEWPKRLAGANSCWRQPVIAPNVQNNSRAKASSRAFEATARNLRGVFLEPKKFGRVLAGAPRPWLEFASPPTAPRALTRQHP